MDQAHLLQHRAFPAFAGPQKQHLDLVTQDHPLTLQLRFNLVVAYGRCGYSGERRVWPGDMVCLRLTGFSA